MISTGRFSTGRVENLPHARGIDYCAEHSGGVGRNIDRPPFVPDYEALKIKHERARPVAVIREAAE